MLNHSVRPTATDDQKEKDDKETRGQQARGQCKPGGESKGNRLNDGTTLELTQSKGEDKEGDRDDVSETDETSGEAQLARKVREPGEPTSAEISDHNITHLPFRSWCAHCVRGKSNNDPHRRRPADEPEIPTIGMDYCSM